MKAKEWRTILSVILRDKYDDQIKVSSYTNLSQVKKELENLNWVDYFDGEWAEIWTNGA